jgi:CRP-like cAMP-binding protein
MNGILQALDRYYPLSDSSKKLLANQLQPLSLTKGQTLIHEDEVSEHIYFIEKGALRTSHGRKKFRPFFYVSK